MPACSAFEAGVSHFTRSLAVEVGNHGVRVNAIAPDVTDTPQTPYHRWVREAEQQKIPSWIPWVASDRRRKSLM